MTPILLLVALQGGRPTVGDTVWIVRTVRVPAGFTVRAPDWKPEGDVELLGRPLVVARGDSADIRFPAVAWRAGRHTVEVPGPLLLAPGGAVDSLPSETRVVAVTSVLPDAPIDSAIAPQPPAGIVARRVTTLRPVLLLVAAAALLLLPLHFWWRRRGKPLPTPVADGGAARPVSPPLARWAAAGERHAVIAAAAARLRARIAARVPEAHAGLDTEQVVAAVAQRHPAWPVAELEELLRALDVARFRQDGAPDDTLVLAERADAMLERLGGEAA